MNSETETHRIGLAAARFMERLEATDLEEGDIARVAIVVELSDERDPERQAPIVYSDGQLPAVVHGGLGLKEEYVGEGVTRFTSDYRYPTLFLEGNQEREEGRGG